MRYLTFLAVSIAAASIAGCAGIEIDGSTKEGITYFEPVPYVLTQTLSDCTQTVTPVVLPGTKRTIRLKPGLGITKQTVTFSNGMIASVNSESDQQIPSLMTAAAAVSSAGIFFTGTKCVPNSILTPLSSGQDIPLPPHIPAPNEEK